MRILFIKYAAIGDVLNATPALRALRERYPDAVIDCLVGKWSAPVLRDNPMINGLIEFDETLFNRKRVGEILALGLRLRARRYDLSVCLHRSFMVNLWVRLIGAKRRLAFLNDRRAGILVHDYVLEDPYRETRHHAIAYYNQVVAKADAHGGTGMDYFLPPATPGVEAFVAERFRPGRTRIGVCAGGARNAHAAEARKRWFLESYAEVIASAPEWDFVLFGAGFDRYSVEHMQKAGFPNVIDAVGAFGLSETAQIIGRCDAFLTHDTGLLHIASALRVPIVALFGPTSDVRHGPLNGDSIVLRTGAACSPCYVPTRNAFAPCGHIRCFREITPAQVVAALRKVLSRKASMEAA